MPWEMRLRDTIHSNPIKATKPMRHGALPHAKQNQLNTTQNTQSLPRKSAFAKSLYPFLLGTVGLMGMASPATVNAQAPAQAVQPETASPKAEREALYKTIKDLEYAIQKDSSQQGQLEAPLDALIQHIKTETDVSLADLKKAKPFRIGGGYTDSIRLRLLSLSDALLLRLSQQTPKDDAEKEGKEKLQGEMETYLLDFPSSQKNLAVEEKLTTVYNKYVSLDVPSSIYRFSRFLDSGFLAHRYVRILAVQKEKILSVIQQELRALPQKPLLEQFEILKHLDPFYIDAMDYLGRHSDARWPAKRSQALQGEIDQKLEAPIEALVKQFFPAYLTRKSPRAKDTVYQKFPEYAYERLLARCLKGPHGDAIFKTCMDQFETAFKQASVDEFLKDNGYNILKSLNHPLPENQQRVMNFITKYLATVPPRACREEIGPILATHFLQQYYATGPKPYQITLQEIQQNLKKNETHMPNLCQALDNPTPKIPLSPLEALIHQMIHVVNTGQNVGVFLPTQPGQKPSEADLKRLRKNSMQTLYNLGIELLKGLPEKGTPLEIGQILDTLGRYNHPAHWRGKYVYKDLVNDVAPFESPIMAVKTLSHKILEHAAPAIITDLKTMQNPTLDSLREALILFRKDDHLLLPLETPQRLLFCETLLEKLSQTSPKILLDPNSGDVNNLGYYKNELRSSLHLFSRLRNRPDIWDRAATIYLHYYPPQDLDAIGSLFFRAETPAMLVRAASPEKAHIIQRIKTQMQALPQKPLIEQFETIGEFRFFWEYLNKKALKTYADEQWPVERSQKLYQDLHEGLYETFFRDTFKPLIHLKHAYKADPNLQFNAKQELVEYGKLVFENLQGPHADKLVDIWLKNIQKELDAAPQDEAKRITLYQEVGALATISPQGQKQVADFIASHLPLESENVCEKGIASALGALWIQYYFFTGDIEAAFEPENQAGFLSHKANDTQAFQATIESDRSSPDEQILPLEKLVKNMITTASTGFSFHPFFPGDETPSPKALSNIRANCATTTLAFAKHLNYFIPQNPGEDKNIAIGTLIRQKASEYETLYRWLDLGYGSDDVDKLKIQSGPEIKHFAETPGKLADIIAKQLTAVENPHLDDEDLASLFAKIIQYHQQHEATLSDQRPYLDKVLPHYKSRWEPFRADAPEAKIHSIYGHQFLNVRDFLYSQAHGNLRQFVLKKNGNTPDPTLDTLAKKVTDASFEVFKYDLSIKLIQKMLKEDEFEVLSKNKQMLHTKMLDKMGLTTSDAAFRHILTQTPPHQLLETLAAHKADAVKNRQTQLEAVWQYHPKHPQSKSIHRPQ